jgi:hypothetical protein
MTSFRPAWTRYVIFSSEPSVAIRRSCAMRRGRAPNFLTHFSFLLLVRSNACFGTRLFSRRCRAISTFVHSCSLSVCVFVWTMHRIMPRRSCRRTPTSVVATAVCLLSTLCDRFRQLLSLLLGQPTRRVRSRMLACAPHGVFLAIATSSCLILLPANARTRCVSSSASASVLPVTRRK